MEEETHYFSEDAVDAAYNWSLTSSQVVFTRSDKNILELSIESAAPVVAFLSDI